LQRSLSLRQRIFGVNHPEVGRSLVGLASTALRLGNYLLAESYAVRAVDILGQVQLEDDPCRAKSLLVLGDICRETGRYSESLAPFSEALAISEANYDKQRGNVATSLERLAGAHYNLGNYVQAEEKFMSAGDSDLDSVWTLLLAAQHDLSELFISDLVDESDRHRTRQGSLANLAEDLEVSLAVGSREYRQRLRGIDVSLDDIAAALPENAALIEYFSFVRVGVTSVENPMELIALVIDDAGSHRIVPPGLLDSIDRVYGLRRAFLTAGARAVLSSMWRITDSSPADFMRRLYSRSEQALRRAFSCAVPRFAIYGSLRRHSGGSPAEVIPQKSTV
jgi:tetratricopeptide (TPR) repeat protein